MSQRRRDLALLGLIAVLAMIARAPAISVGLMSDDFMQHGMLAGLYPGEGYAPFDLYAFLRRGEVMIAHVEKGTAPWWSVPELHGTVLRPVASALSWLDHRLFPGRVELWHAHSLLWFGATIVAFGLALGRQVPRSIALIAAVLFACEAGLVSPLGWLANRCSLICATFGFLAMYVHFEWRTPEPETPAWLRRRGPIVEGVLMALSIGAGEYGLGILAYLLVWELVRGPREPRVRARVRALLPALIPIVIYLVIHKLAGYGTFGAEVYADPFHTPDGYLKWASKRLPKLVSSSFWSVPAATIHVFRFGWLEPIAHWWLPDEPSPDEYHAAHLRMAWLGVALALAVVALARRGLRPDEREAVGVLIIGALLGLLPIAVAPAHSRLLVIAQLGACTAVAAVLVAVYRLVRAGPAREAELDGVPQRLRLRGLALVPIAGLLAAVHTIGDLRWGHAYLEHIDELQAENLAAFIEGDVLDHELGGRDVVILNAPSQSLGLYGEFVLDANGWPAPRSWRPLALGGEFAMVAKRRDASTLELSAVQGAWMHTAGELFFRREDQPLHAGDVIEYPSLRVEILADDGGHPSAIRFDFRRPLEQLVFVIATPEGLRRWPVPAVGKIAIVPLPRLPHVDDPDAVVFPPYEPER